MDGSTNDNHYHLHRQGIDIDFLPSRKIATAANRAVRDVGRGKVVGYVNLEVIYPVLLKASAGGGKGMRIVEICQPGALTCLDARTGKIGLLDNTVRCGMSGSSLISLQWQSSATRKTCQ